MAAADPQRSVLIITNTDATNPVYLGSAGVTSTNGDKLAAGQSLVLDGPAATAAVSAKATGSTVVVSVMTVDVNS